jgi:hypothetical protein
LQVVKQGYLDVVSPGPLFEATNGTDIGNKT